jgi:hypothetical protein
MNRPGTDPVSFTYVAYDGLGRVQFLPSLLSRWRRTLCHLKRTAIKPHNPVPKKLGLVKSTARLLVLRGLNHQSAGAFAETFWAVS